MPNPRVTVGVTGGVAAYKAAELVRTLQQLGCDVHVVMTRAAEEFVRPLTFSSLTGHKVITSLWSEAEATGQPSGQPSGLDADGQIEHIAEAQAIDALVIAPATAHVLAKLAHGLADDFLTTLHLATTAPVIVAPAMNVNMWNHPATQANLQLLQSRSVIIVEPGSGYLACGMTGSGRLAEIDDIASAVMSAIADRSALATERAAATDATPPVILSKAKDPLLDPPASARQPPARTERRRRDLEGETVLVTAGGTRESIDPVRFLGNRSSGKMGYALAEAAHRRGARVVLVSAPASLTPPAQCAFVPVTSAEEMRAAVMEHLPHATIVIKAAAVADFRMAPHSVSDTKLRRESSQYPGGHLHLDLEPTEDIVRGVVDAHGEGTLVIAFAAEMNADIAQARAKLLRKGADAIVLNDISRPGIGFDSDRNAATFVTPSDAIEIPEMSKRDMADRILDQVLTLRRLTPTPARA